MKPMSCALAGAWDQQGSPRDCFLFQWDWVGPQGWFWHQTRSRILARLASSGETRAALSLEVIVSWSGVPAWCLWIRKLSTLYSKSMKCPWLWVSFKHYLVLVGRGISFLSLRKLLTFKCSSVLRWGCTADLECSRALECCDGRAFPLFGPSWTPGTVAPPLPSGNSL